MAYARTRPTTREWLAAGLEAEHASWLMPAQVGAVRAARLAAPAAVSARKVSADAYHGMSAVRAEKLANSTFGDAVLAPDGGMPRLGTGQRLLGFASRFAARVTRPDGSNALIDSITPIASTGPSGALTPVDLALRTEGNGFVGVHPLVAASLPKHLREGARLTSLGLSVVPVDAEGRPLGGSAGTIDGSNEFVGNSLLDTDSVLKLSTYGLAIDTILRSQDSPRQFGVRVGLPVGAHLLAGPAGSVRLIRHRKTVAWMPAPAAVDAAGSDVPVSVSVRGDVIRLTVAAGAGAVQYPVAVDPEFNTVGENLKLEARDWPFTHEGGFIAGYAGTSNMWIHQEGASVGQWGALNYVTNGDSKIYEFNSTVSTEEAVGNGTEYWITSSESFVELAGSGGQEAFAAVFQPNVHYTESPRHMHICPGGSCTPGVGVGGNTARVVLRATNAGSGQQVRVTAASVAIAQPKETHGTVAYNRSSPEIEYTSGGKVVKTSNVLYPGGGWLSPTSGAIEYTSEDAGLGVSGTMVQVKNAGSWWTEVAHEYLNTATCAGVQCAKGQKEVITYSTLHHASNGEQTLRVAARDPMANTWSYEHAEGEAVVKVDAEAPYDLAVEGLAEGESEYEYQLDESVGHVTLFAVDGSGTTPSSGLKSLKLAIDGKEIGSGAAYCSPGPCTATREMPINGGELGAGMHVMTVTATDNAGNVATREFGLDVHHASSVPFGAGSVNPESGAFTLENTDVNMSGGDGALTIGRSYDSRDVTSGSEGPLGPQWRISTGSLASLEVLPDGSVMVLGPDGMTHFAKNASGAFEPPAGDTNLVLEAVKSGSKVIAYLFENPTAGTTTKFTLPSGAKSWMPTVSEGPIATDTTTDEYTTAEPQAGRKLVEPILEVAPHPFATCAYKKLEKGCRALEFNYAASTTATGENESEWGDYKGNLTRVYFIAWDPASGSMKTSTVAQYAYDAHGRLRAEWDPRISPALKTVYGYDPEGHVTALTVPGTQTTAYIYGMVAGDTSAGRLMRSETPSANGTLWAGSMPVNTVAPTVAPSPPELGLSVQATAGTWSGSPVGYRYQWQRCNSAGSSCVAIAGANNLSYTPRLADAGRAIRVEVQAINGGGSTVAYSAATVPVSTGMVYSSGWGSEGTGNGQFQHPMGIAVDRFNDVWVADTAHDRVEEFSESGTFIRSIGSEGTGHGQFKEPTAVSIDGAGDVLVADSGNNRVQQFGWYNGEFIKQFGTAGSGAGQLLDPQGVAGGCGSNVWVSDTGNGRLEEFNGNGVFVRAVSGPGTGETFGSVASMACDNQSNVWVSDAGRRQVFEFSEAGELLRAVGGEGTGPGLFSQPGGISIDSTGTVWVSDSPNKRIEAFNMNGEYQAQFGVSGSGAGQMNEPMYVAASPTGMVFVSERGNQRVQAFTRANVTFNFTSQFGSVGTGAGQFQSPKGVAVDPAGDVWVADTSNNRVEEFSEGGTFIRSAGSEGTGPGQFKKPTSLAATSAGSVWVVDTQNERVQQLSSTGTFVRQFGSSGTGAGQFVEPAGIAICPSGNIWVSDKGGYRVEEFTSTGEYIRQSGTYGSGNGQFQSPSGIACDAANDVWVGDENTNRIEELSPTGSYMTVIGRLGVGSNGIGRFSPKGLSIDASGLIWVADNYDNRVAAFRPNGEYVTQYAPSGEHQLKEPFSLAISATGSAYVLDTGNDHVQRLAYPETPETPPPANAAGESWVTIEYNVPISGTGAPYAMSAASTATWAQNDVPTVATAFFPPDSPEPWPAPQYKRAQVVYMDAQARTVNVASPGGSISTTEYNEYNDVVRTLSPIDRAAALGHGEGSASYSRLLDNESFYSNQGSRLVETLGPLHVVKAAKGNEKTPKGSEVEARLHVRDFYDEGAPATGETYNLVTKTISSAETLAHEEFDPRTTTMAYSGQENLGWKLRAPTSSTTDPSGLNLTSTTVYDGTTGNVLETRAPASSGASDPHDRVSVYYTAAANPSHPACGGHVEWSGLLCQALPGKQPETSGLPPLPVTTTSYNVWDQPETVSEAFGSTTRTKKTTYDAAGRPVTSEVTSSAGTPLPAVTDHYNEHTGALEKQSEMFEGSEKTVTSVYNSLGRLEKYTDADGGFTAYFYDTDGRPLETRAQASLGGESRGSQTFKYDPITGLMTSLTNNLVGTFTATYDAAGRIATETYPNKMIATYTRDAAGETTGIEYTKTTHCASSCPERWFSETVTPSVHGEALSQSSTLSNEPVENYDEAGRLVEVQEIPVGQGCTSRLYSYDNESNRTGLTTRAPGAEGKCASEGGSAETHAYDTANRLIDSGVFYDALGNITKLPAADAGGAGMEVTSKYYVSSQLATQEQAGKTTSYFMDPTGRLRETRSPSVQVSHYVGSGSLVSWVAEPAGAWSGNMFGIDGAVSAVRAGSGVVTLQLHDLQGNVVATAAPTESQTKLLSTYASTEFGVPINGAPPKYAWLGAEGVTSESGSGLMVNNGVTYVPQLGRTIQSSGIVLPNPDNAGMPYVAVLAPWVVEGTASVVQQLTSAEQARKAAEEAARLAGNQQSLRPPIAGGSGEEEEALEPGEARASGERPTCKVKWAMDEFNHNGTMELSGGFLCEHHVANMEIRLCMWMQLPGEKFWTQIYCAGPEGRLIFQDSKGEEILVSHGCQTGALYTGTIWAHEWATGHKDKGTYFKIDKDEPYAPGHENMMCEPDAGNVQEEIEAL
ncbi:MAG TPA: 6-bladed beta-propeller [Solirubrobacteraceae bacterium]